MEASTLKTKIIWIPNWFREPIIPNNLTNYLNLQNRTVPTQMLLKVVNHHQYILTFSAFQINDIIKDNILCAFSYPSS